MFSKSIHLKTQLAWDYLKIVHVFIQYLQANVRIISCCSPNLFLSKCLFLLWRCDPTRVMASSFLRYLHHTQRRTTVGGTPLDEWSACRRDLYLTTHNTHNRQISMPSVGFEPTISAGERPQTYVLDRTATGTGFPNAYFLKIYGQLLNPFYNAVTKLKIPSLNNKRQLLFIRSGMWERY